MESYRIPVLPEGTAAETIDWSTVPAARINTYRWRTGHAPKAEARLVFVAEHGFYLHMRCAESSPRAVYRDYMDPVYTDSCLEFFADWLGDGRYINLEMNANGAQLSCIGPNRHHRTPIAERTGGDIFPIKAEVFTDAWCVTATLPLDLLARVLGVKCLTVGPGFAFRGNFYKCGDATAMPHYGMWHPVESEHPDFHRPEFFGKIVVG